MRCGAKAPPGEGFKRDVDLRRRLDVAEGDFTPDFSSFIGSRVIEALPGIHHDVPFVSVPAVARGTCFHAPRSAADLERAFMRSAELSVLLVGHTKTARRAVHRTCTLAELDAVLIDAGGGPGEVARVQVSGADVVPALVDAAGPGTASAPLDVELPTAATGHALDSPEAMW